MLTLRATLPAWAISLLLAAALPAAAQESGGDDSTGYPDDVDTIDDNGSGSTYMRLLGGYSRFGEVELTSTANVEDPDFGIVQVDETKQFEDYDTGVALSVAMGRYLANDLRVEGGFTVRNASRNQGDSDFVTVSPSANQFTTRVTSYSLLANGYRDFSIEFDLKPMVGVGVGLSRVAFEASYDSSTNRAEFSDANNAVISGQVMNGVAYELSQTLDVFVEGRYFATLPFKIEDENGNVSRAALSSFDLLVGTAVRF